MSFISGIRVLDLCDERGLLAGRLLADMGADVVRLEPSDGNTARAVAPRPANGGTSYFWTAYAANSRSVEADLDTAGGRAVFEALAGAADVLLTTWTATEWDASGVDRHTLAHAHPGLVIVSITPFGMTGPKADWPASDLTVWAAGGPLDEHRPDEADPLRPSVPQSFLQAAADGAVGALLALVSRAQTGLGQFVDVSAQASVAASTLARVLTHPAGDAPREMFKGMRLEEKPVDQSGSGSATDPATKKWACVDGLVEYHLSIGAAAGGFTNRFVAWLVDEGVDLGRYGDLDYRTVPDLIARGAFTDEDTTALRAKIREFFLTKTKEQILTAAVDRKLLCVPIFDTGDVVRSAQLAHRKFWTTVGSDDRRTTLPGPFAQVDREAFSLSLPAPRIGEHSATIVEEWATDRTVRALMTDPAAGRDQAEQRDALPLEGLRVLDFSWVVAGPSVTRVLADFGATVVRVENPHSPETARLMQPYYGGKPHTEASALFGTWNAGKFGVTLDLATGQGQEAAHDLVAWADVVVESFSPGVLERWGLDGASLRKEHPALIVLSASLNGQAGPWAKMAGFGNIGAALSGFQSIVGRPDGPPLGPFGPYTDFVAPRFALVALLSAILDRRTSGEGCTIDLAQVEAGVWLQSAEMAQFHREGTVVERRGNADREFAPHGVYPSRTSADGPERFIAIAVTDDAQWTALATTINRPDLADDADLGTAAGRRRRAPEIDRAIAAWTSARTGADAQDALVAAGVPAHVSADSEDFCTDPQILHRQHLVELPHSLHGTVTVEAARIGLSRTPGGPRAAAPLLGEHNRFVFDELLHDSEAQGVRQGAAAPVTP